MISSEQCKYCDRDIFVIGKLLDGKHNVWAHVHTQHSWCAASDIINSDLESAWGTRSFRAAPEDG